MLYSNLVKVYGELEATTKRLEKTKIISDFLKKIKKDELKIIIYLLEGRVFPEWDMRKIGISSQIILKIISKSTGIEIKNIEQKWKSIGDLGLVAKELIKNKKQMTLSSKNLTIEKVYSNLRKTAEVEGRGAIAKKIDLISELLTNANPEEAKFIVRTVLEELRIGVASGVIRDSIASAFGIEIKNVEKAHDFLSDYGEVVEKARKNKLKDISPTIGRPFHSMEALKGEDLKKVLKEINMVGIEKKFDGYKLQVHKKGNEILLFTRKQEEITNAFPDLVEFLKKSLKPKNCIVEGECIALTKNKKPLPFQYVSKRIKRKYNIKEVIRKIPVQIQLFDILLLGSKNLINKSLIERRKELVKAVKEIKDKVEISEQIVTNDFKKVNRFYKNSLKNGHEGIMIKNLDAFYQPGRRVGYQYKIKPVLEPLDLVIIGADYGTGKRAHVLSSFLLACKKNDKFLPCGMMGTGIKEKEGITFKVLTKKLKPFIISEKGRRVEIKPSLVIEVTYEEIQKSPNYESGFALRFPRLSRLRDDKGTHQANTLEDIKRIFMTQKGKK